MFVFMGIKLLVMGVNGFDAARRAEVNKSDNKFCLIFAESNEHLVDEAIASVSKGVRTKSRAPVESALASSACANMCSASSSNSSDQHAALDLDCRTWSVGRGEVAGGAVSGRTEMD